MRLTPEVHEPGPAYFVECGIPTALEPSFKVIEEVLRCFFAGLSDLKIIHWVSRAAVLVEPGRVWVALGHYVL